MNVSIVILDPSIDKDIDTGCGAEYKGQKSESLPASYGQCGRPDRGVYE